MEAARSLEVLVSRIGVDLFVVVVKLCDVSFASGLRLLLLVVLSTVEAFLPVSQRIIFALISMIILNCNHFHTTITSNKKFEITICILKKVSVKCFLYSFHI